MDIYDYINSPDIMKYLKDIDYEFSTYEMVCIVGKSYKSQEERFDGFRWIMENLPDEPLKLSVFRNFYNDFLSELEDPTKPFELNTSPFYTKLEHHEFYKRCDSSGVTDKQKAAFDELFDNYINTSIISYANDITEEEFFNIIRVNNSLFGMLHFYMNNIEYFYCEYYNPNKDSLFPLNLPLPFYPGQIVRSCFIDQDVVWVIIDNIDNKISSLSVSNNGFINYPYKIDFYDFKLVAHRLDYPYAKTADILSDIIKNMQNSRKISIEDFAEALNKQYDYMIEMAKKDTDNN